MEMPVVETNLTEQQFDIHALKQVPPERIPYWEVLNSSVTRPDGKFCALCVQGANEVTTETWENEYTDMLSKAIIFYDSIGRSNTAILLQSKLDLARIVQRYLKTRQEFALREYSNFQYNIYKQSVAYNHGQEYEPVAIQGNEPGLDRLKHFPPGILLFPTKEAPLPVRNINYVLPDGYSMPNNRYLKVGGLSLQEVGLSFTAEQIAEAGNAVVLVVEKQDGLDEAELSNYIEVFTNGDTLVIEIKEAALSLERLKISVQKNVGAVK